MSNMNCNPMNSLYCNLKVKLTGHLSSQDLEGLYSCTLCDECHTAGFNRVAREIAVNKNFIAPHVGTIGQNVRETGNPYGIRQPRGRNGTERCETILFRGCTPAYRTPEILAAVERLLQSKGIEYGFMDDEACCGNVLFNLGDRASGEEAVARNIGKLKAAGVKRIITLCPGCYSAFNRYYQGRDGFDAEIVLALDLLEGMTMAGDGYVVQDSCHAREKAGVVRRMLPGVADRSPSQCCGAGSGLVTHDRLLATAKAEKVFGDGTAKVITYCPFCYLNLRAVRPDGVQDFYVLMEQQDGRPVPQDEGSFVEKPAMIAEARISLREKLACLLPSGIR